ncbi:hypothetical protein [Actinomyces massiliensis]|uniref:hypothetical protein n=1 Tax=Actinomyces massiliensis TaxID=461393 RepID=UPI0028EA3CC9|nr:hypothetical protein [Actinomyces massiliensis]
MGIEVWVLVALVAILAVYLLPFLVGRREVMRLSNAEDRYSSELRVLATGDAVASESSDEACVSSGRAQIFRRRPEVKAMNRPAVRNVRALRIERELTRARQAHGEARERRRVAASHRAAVACTLVGIMLGLVAVCVLTALPWLSIAVPGALLMVSMGAGRRAARASAELDRNERRRIADLENELTDLTGERSVAATPVWPIKPKDLREAEPEEAESTAAKPAAARPAAAARADERLVERESAGADRETPVVGRTSSKRRSASAAPAAEAARSASVSRTRTSAGDTEAYAEARAETPADRARKDRSGAAVRPVAQPSARAVDEERPEERKTLSAVAGSSDSSGSVDSSPVVDREAAESAETVVERPAAVSDISEGAAAQRALMAVAWPVSEVEGEDDAAPRRAPLSASAGSVRGGASARKPAASAASEEAAPATPPQGWRPVHVPAPTYTLAARAPRRALEDLEETSFPSAPVPERPTSVRRLPTEGVENEEIEFHPIDLDAVLEKRRAAGA